MNNTKALVVLSGGQDSVTCLGYALNSYKEVEAVCFTYGQNHSVEVVQAQLICEKLGVPITLVDIPALSQFGDSALTTGGDVTQAHHRTPNLPASFVPARNATFLTLAHGLAQKICASTIITGVCQTDYSGYPDCRNIFIQAIAFALNLGYETQIKILTPLMYLTKAQTFEMASKYDILDIVIRDSHTCYNGVRTPHEWGAGCGECGACELRAKGFYEWRDGVVDNVK